MQQFITISKSVHQSMTTNCCHYIPKSGEIWCNQDKSNQNSKKIKHVEYYGVIKSVSATVDNVEMVNNNSKKVSLCLMTTTSINNLLQ